MCTCVCASTVCENLQRVFRSTAHAISRILRPKDPAWKRRYLAISAEFIAKLNDSLSVESPPACDYALRLKTAGCNDVARVYKLIR